MVEQNTQAVVLKQPNGEKLQLELKITQVADDTTAMKSFEKGADISIASFDYATGIAVFLALCATGLAYWFGVRSFVLTKQSFDSLIEQIKSSENVTLETNQDLIKSQDKQKKIELHYHKNQQWINQVIEARVNISILSRKYFIFYETCMLILKDSKEGCDGGHYSNEEFENDCIKGQEITYELLEQLDFLQVILELQAIENIETSVLCEKIKLKLSTQLIYLINKEYYQDEVGNLLLILQDKVKELLRKVFEGKKAA